jgi:hypothetical protein
MNDESSDPLDETVYQMPKSAVGILQRGEIDVYIIPASDAENHTSRLVVALLFESGALLTGSSANLSAETDSLSVEYGAYRTFPFRRFRHSVTTTSAFGINFGLESWNRHRNSRSRI